MATLRSDLILSLIDKVTGPARGIAGSLGRINGAVSRFNRANMAALGLGGGGFAGRLLALGAGYVGVTQGIDGTFNAARRLQGQLTEIGIKSDMSAGQIALLRQRMLSLAPTVNQTTTELVGGVDSMITLGATVDDAVASIPAIGKAATATRSSVTDLSAASVSAMQNMNVHTSQIAQMLDSMTSAGNAGAFEMRDMAQYFPQLTASAKALGMDGVDGVSDIAAALQIARRGAGDASTAANNLSNFLGKIMSPEVIKNFKKFGVDVTKELKKAHKDGVSPLEHFIKLIDEKTKGGQADLLGQLFGDKQVLDFVRPMLADFKDYLRIRGDAEKATGTVAAAYAQRMKDADERLKALQIRIQNAGVRIGAGLLEPVAKVADYFANIFDTLGERVTVFDKIGAAVRGFMGGLGFSADGSMIKQIGDFLFGVKTDGARAADQLGAIAYSFRSLGEAVSKGVEPFKPALKWLAEMSGMGMGFFAVSAGIGLLAGAVSRLGNALLVLSGAKLAFGLLKQLGKLTKWGATAASVDAIADAIDVDRDGRKSGRRGGRKGGKLASANRAKAKAMMSVWDDIPGMMSNIPLVGKSAVRFASHPAVLAAVAAAAMFSRLPGRPDQATGQGQVDAHLASRQRTGTPYGGAPLENGLMRVGAGQAPAIQPLQPSPLDQLRNTVLQIQQQGTSDVRVTNPTPIVTPMTNNITVNVQQVADVAGAVGQAVANAAAAAAQRAVQGAYVDGGL